VVSGLKIKSETSRMDLALDISSGEMKEEQSEYNSSKPMR